MKGKNTIIYIGNDNIIVLEGITNKPNKSPIPYKNIDLPTGTVIMGVIQK